MLKPAFLLIAERGGHISLFSDPTDAKTDPEAEPAGIRILVQIRLIQKSNRRTTERQMPVTTPFGQ
jgi:hypothetical protein